jgi:DNA-binding response OmpR family regulator
MEWIEATLLIVEDDVFTCNTLSEYLKRRFRSVWSANSEEEAWTLYEKYKPDIVLSDIEMPDGNGLDFIKRIRTNDAKTRIYVLSGFPTQDYLLEAVKLHLEDFIRKPISTYKLNQFVEQCGAHFSASRKMLSHKEGISYSNRRKVLSIKEHEVHLTHMEINLLELLMEHEGEIVSYETIENELYGDKTFNKDSLRTLLSRLRKKLGGCLIFSHPDVGYRLVTD